jgi:hypothetical protein
MPKVPKVEKQREPRKHERREGGVLSWWVLALGSGYSTAYRKKQSHKE